MKSLRQYGASLWKGRTLVALLVLALGFWFLPRVLKPERTGAGGVGPAAGAEAKGQPGLRFKDLKFVGHSKGERQWEFVAGVVDVPKDANVVEFRQVRSGTVFREGKPYLKVLASSGRYYVREENFIIEGGVTVVSNEGDVFKTGSLQWNPQTRQITSIGEVEGKVEGLRFRANRFAVDLTGEWLLASGDVQVVKDNGDSFLCEDLVYSFKDDTWQMQGQVDLTIEL